LKIEDNRLIKPLVGGGKELEKWNCRGIHAHHNKGEDVDETYPRNPVLEGGASAQPSDEHLMGV